MRKLTLLLDDDVYDGLQRVAGKGNIGHFVSEKVRPYLLPAKLGSVEEVFGSLKEFARPGTKAEIEAAKQQWMRKRWAAKANTGAKG
ncbi:MAG: hypothetical protein EON92_16710 [Burkholderiales bacterium]|nr:MAG: hypothetical protein EON92_16710 [Burkholderiales bacterium]